MYKNTETTFYVISAVIAPPAMEPSMLFWNKNREDWTEDVSKAMHYSSYGAASYLLGPTCRSSGHLGNWGIKPLKAKYGDMVDIKILKVTATVKFDDAV
jgi:hypothetical protein